jgi:hypothetical protein
MDRLRPRVLLSAMLALPAASSSFLAPSAPPPASCFRAGVSSYRIGADAAAVDYRVRVAPDAAQADIRVGLIDSPDLADFVLVDDAPDAQAAYCRDAAAKSIGLGGSDGDSSLVVTLARGARAPDYRLYVASARFSPDQAAALLAVLATAGDPPASDVRRADRVADAGNPRR